MHAAVATRRLFIQLFRRLPAMLGLGRILRSLRFALLCLSPIEQLLRRQVFRGPSVDLFSRGCGAVISGKGFLIVVIAALRITRRRDFRERVHVFLCLVELDLLGVLQYGGRFRRPACLLELALHLGAV